MTTVIDALVMTLGLDSSNFTKGQKEVAASFAKTKDVAVKAGKDVEKSGKDMAEALSKATQGVLTLAAAFLGGKGIKEFVGDASKANTALGNLGASLGASPQFISAFSMAAARMGGSAGAAKASIQSLSDALVDFRTQGKNLPQEVWLLQGNSGVNIDTQHGVEAYVGSLAKAANILAKTDPAQADRFLRAIGLDPETAQLMVQHGARFKDYVNTMKSIAPSDRDLKAAAQLTDHFGHLNDEFGNLATKIATALGPHLDMLADKISDLIDWTSKWVEANPGLTEAIVGFFTLLSGGAILLAIANVGALAAALTGLVAANGLAAGAGLLGILASAGILGAGAIAGAAILNPTDLNGGEDEIARQKRYGHGGGGDGSWKGGRRGLGKLGQNANARVAIEELRKAGYNDNAIAAVVGSMQTESSFNPFAHNDIKGTHDGAWQWDTRRWGKISSWITAQGGNPRDWRWQTKAWIAEHNARPGDALYDNKNTEMGGRLLRNNPSLGDAVHGVRLSERFGPGEEGGRATNAGRWLPNLGAARVAALSNIANNHRVSTTTSSNQMHVNNIHVNAPQATDAKGIAGSIDKALADNMFASHANYGPY